MSDFVLRPELLTQPNLPKPLHGVNPRTIKGNSWWNKIRKEAYARHDYHCWACGIHKDQSMYRAGILECHEIYRFDYNTGECSFDGVCALCHPCHSFIHSGRLYALWNESKIGTRRANRIYNHGFDLLKENGLKPNEDKMKSYLKFMHHRGKITADECRTRLQNADVVRNQGKAKWEDFYLLLDGERHYSKFANWQEWKDSFKGKRF